MNYLVYKHTSPSGKSYIGITCDYDRRCMEHQKYDWCPAFHAAIKKYGWDSFTHEILQEGITEETALLLEPALIIEHNTRYPYGYNLSAGGMSGMSGSTHSEATIERIRTKAQERTRTPEHRAMVSATRKANPIPAEQQKRMAAARVGKPFSEERKRKLSEAARRREQRKREEREQSQLN